MSDDLAPWITAGLVLIVVGLVGLYLQHAGRAGVLGRVAVAVAVVGVVLLGASSVGGWWIFFAGFLAIVVGLLLFGIAVLFAEVFPWWVSTLLCLTATSLVLFNTEDARAWLLVPFGAAWVVLGYLLWSRRYDQLPKQTYHR
jgi:hypothetical protein